MYSFLTGLIHVMDRCLAPGVDGRKRLRGHINCLWSDSLRRRVAKTGRENERLAFREPLEIPLPLWWGRRRRFRSSESWCIGGARAKDELERAPRSLVTFL